MQEFPAPRVPSMVLKRHDRTDRASLTDELFHALHTVEIRRAYRQRSASNLRYCTRNTLMKYVSGFRKQLKEGTQYTYPPSAGKWLTGELYYLPFHMKQ